MGICVGREQGDDDSGVEKLAGYQALHGGRDCVGRSGITTRGR